jgi:hypothetical protein
MGMAMGALEANRKALELRLTLSMTSQPSRWMLNAKIMDDDGRSSFAASMLKLGLAKSRPQWMEVMHESSVGQNAVKEDSEQFTRGHISLDDRHDIRYHALICEAIQHFWQWITRQGPEASSSSLSKASYCSLLFTIQSVLLPKFGLEPEAAYDPSQDWESVLKGKDLMCYPDFFDNLFELTDLWCEEVSAEAYAAFLNDLLSKSKASGMIEEALKRFGSHQEASIPMPSHPRAMERRSPPSLRATTTRDFIPPPILEAMPPTWFKAKLFGRSDYAPSERSREDKRSPSPPASRSNTMPLVPPTNLVPTSPSRPAVSNSQSKRRQRVPSAVTLVVHTSPTHLNHTSSRVKSPGTDSLAPASAHSPIFSPLSPSTSLAQKASWSDHFIEKLLTKTISGGPESPRLHSPHKANDDARKPPQEIVLESPFNTQGRISISPSRSHSKKEALRYEKSGQDSRHAPLIWVSSQLQAERSRAVNKGLVQLGVTTGAKHS